MKHGRTRRGENEGSKEGRKGGQREDSTLDVCTWWEIHTTLAGRKRARASGVSFVRDCFLHKTDSTIGRTQWAALSQVTETEQSA